MGACCSSTSAVPQNRSSSSAGGALQSVQHQDGSSVDLLLPHAHDVIDALLNRWRHDEITVLQRCFRAARESAAAAAKQEKRLSLTASFRGRRASSTAAATAAAVTVDAAAESLGDPAATAVTPAAGASTAGASTAGASTTGSLEQNAATAAAAANGGNGGTETAATGTERELLKKSSFGGSFKLSSVPSFGLSTGGGGANGASDGDTGVSLSNSTKGSSAAAAAATGKGLSVEAFKLAFPQLLPHLVPGAFACFSTKQKAVAAGGWLSSSSHASGRSGRSGSSGAAGAAVSFRDFARALALCCRGTDDERRRFLLDMFADTAAAVRYYGRAEDGTPRSCGSDLPEGSGNAPYNRTTSDSPAAEPAIALTAAEFSALLQYCGLPMPTAVTDSVAVNDSGVAVTDSATVTDSVTGSDSAAVNGISDTDTENGIGNSSSGGTERSKQPLSTAVSAVTDSATVDGITVEGVTAEGEAVTGITLAQYFEWAETALTHAKLDAALAPFYLLPLPHQELEVALTFLKLPPNSTGLLCSGDAAYLVEMQWWLQWAQYSGLASRSHELAPTVAAGLGLKSAAVQSNSSRIAVTDVTVTDVTADTETASAAGSSNLTRPYEINNGPLQKDSSWSLAPDLTECVHFVAVPYSLWSALYDWYGGGPAFDRQVIDSSSDPEVANSSSGESRVSTCEPGTHIDLYPIGCSVSLCDAAGLSGKAEHQIFVNKHATVSAVLHSALEALSIEPSSDGFTPLVTESSDVAAVTGARLWVLEGAKEQATLVPRAGAPPGTFSGAPAQKGLLAPNTDMLQQGSAANVGLTPAQDKATLLAIKRWRPLHSQLSATFADQLQLLGEQSSGTLLSTCFRLLLEVQATDSTTSNTLSNSSSGGTGSGGSSSSTANNGGWPRARFIETPRFRAFQIGDRLDAVDSQGRWCPGTVVTVTELSEEAPPQDSAAVVLSSSQHNSSTAAAATAAAAPVKLITVRFDHAAPLLWDEGYRSDSLRLAPLHCHTPPAGTVPQNGTGTAPQNGSSGTNAAAAAAKADASAGNTNISKSTMSGSGSSSSISTLPQQQLPTGAAPSSNVPGTVPGIISLRSGELDQQGNFRDSSAPVSKPTSAVPANGLGSSPGKVLRQYRAPVAPVAAGEVRPSSLTNYNGNALNRRSNTNGTPPLSGACGLVNTGNSCYLNSAVQCLSHTPLLRAYLLSGMYRSEVNLTNPLGSQGRLVDDFAQLLQQLWSGSFLCVFPNKFTRTLGKQRSQFAGNEQQDGQEFLTVILDALHEDVNRVLVKPIVAPAEDDGHQTSTQLAKDAWSRHLLRNRSVIVDLFQGQLKMDCKCATCGKASVSFDPFMFLSVPIPATEYKPFVVLLLRRIALRNSSSTSSSDGNGSENRDPHKAVPVRYGLKLPRLGSVGDLLAALCSASGIADSSCLVLAQVARGHHAVVYDAQSPLAMIREDDFLVCYEKTWRKQHTPASTNQQASHSPQHPSNGISNIAAAAAAAAAAADGDSSNAAAASSSSASGVRELSVDVGREEAVESDATAFDEGCRSPGSDTDDMSGEYSDLEDAQELQQAATAAKNVTDAHEEEAKQAAAAVAQWPAKFDDVQVGLRCDAMDHRGVWYSGTVEQVQGTGDSRRVRVHFDRFEPRWDEWYGTVAWRKTCASPPTTAATAAGPGNDPVQTAGSNSSSSSSSIGNVKLAPLLSQASAAKSRGLTWLSVINMKEVTHHTDSLQQAGLAPKADTTTQQQQQQQGATAATATAAVAQIGTTRELFGLPLLLHCHGARSLRCLWRQVVKQASRSLAGDAPKALVTALVTAGLLQSDTETLSFAAAAALAAGSAVHRTSRAKTTAAETVTNGVTVTDNNNSNSSSNVSALDDLLMRLLPFRVLIVDASAPLVSPASLPLLPDGSLNVATFIPPKHAIALLWSIPAFTGWSTHYRDPLIGAVDHASYTQLQASGSASDSGITLNQCLTAFTKEETLEDDSWYCSNCATHRRAHVKIQLWKLPDILVIHIKRFHHSSRYREKLKSLVVFPQSGLDMDPFVCNTSPGSNEGSGNEGTSQVYDLYSVVNHMGGLTGGHYTAFCRYTHCGSTGVEEVASGGYPMQSNCPPCNGQSGTGSCNGSKSTVNSHPWLYFDDEFVEELDPSKVVSEMAYVLFYRRRRLTAANVVNTTV